MRLSASDLDYYRDTLAQIGADASEYVRGAIKGLGTGIGVTDMRLAAIEAITETVGIHGERAQALAGQLFDEVCAAEGMGPFDFELLDDIIDFGMLEEKVRWFAGKLVETDGADRFLDDCGALADFYARRCNWESMTYNCYRNNVRYARVPTGIETCDWCIMLASRGFVYWSAEDAEHANHRSCDCVVIPGGQSTSIDGYDPGELYAQWKESGFMPSSGGGSKTASRFKRHDTRVRRGGTDSTDYQVTQRVERFGNAKSAAELERMMDTARVELASYDMDPTRWARLWDSYRAAKARF